MPHVTLRLAVGVVVGVVGVVGVDVPVSEYLVDCGSERPPAAIRRLTAVVAA